MKLKSLLVVFSLLFLLTSACSNNAEIKQQHVDRIIKTLSADEMKGRHSFSPEIRDAADFIAEEFHTIGLDSLPFEDDYFQDFSIFSITPSNTTISINGITLDDPQFFGLLKEGSFSWNTTDAELQYITSDDNFRATFREYVSNDQANVIVVHEDHEKLFHRYRTYFNRSNRVFKLAEQPNDVFVLYSGAVQSYNITFENTVKDIPLYNVSGMIEGQKTDEIVLITAHYDHIGVISPMDDDSVANGANDNASGVAGVIELARYFSQQPKPERTLYFVAFTAEETGGFGSKYFSQQIDPDQIVAMINIEMIGKPAIEGPDSGWITGFHFSDLGTILQNSIDDSSFVFYPDPYPGQNLFYRSDNAPFAALGIPAHTISTTPMDMDQDYHNVTDEFNTLNVLHATHTIQAIAKGTSTIVSGEQTPSRIHPDSLQ